MPTERCQADTGVISLNDFGMLNGLNGNNDCHIDQVVIKPTAITQCELNPTPFKKDVYPCIGTPANVDVKTYDASIIQQRILSESFDEMLVYFKYTDSFF